jgi:hypothetical protein
MESPYFAGPKALLEIKEMENKMKHMKKISWFLMAFALIALTACGGGAVAPTVDTAPLFTQVAGTAQVLQTQVAQDATVIAGNALQPAPTLAATPTLQPTPTPAATDTPLVAPTPQPTNTPLPPPATAKVPAPVTNLNTAPGAGGLIPSMSVTLLANDLSGFAMTISAGTSLIFRAEVQNTGQVPLEVVANLAVPDGWDVDQNVFSDCPKTEDLNHNDTCTISWYFTPQGSGQVYLRVYVRGIYTDFSGNSARITDSPAYLINVK